MAHHMHTELERLKKELIRLFSLVEESVGKATQSIKNRDRKLAKEVIENDGAVDLLEVEIEEECLKILALHQPVAIDLRFIIAVLKINNDLERIADLSVNIAERTLFLCHYPVIKVPLDLTTMAQKTRQMLRGALDCLIQQDIELAHKVWKDDNEVDEINRSMYEVVFARIKENPDEVESLAQYVSVSRHLERMADYATNIAEDVIYMIEGTIVRHSPDIFAALEDASDSSDSNA